MDYVPPNLITDRGITVWTNDAAEQMNRGKTVQSQDLIITKTPQGTKIALKRRHKLGNENPYKGEYDATKHYGVGDIVRVLPGETYNDASGSPVKAMVGVWECVANVPDEKISNKLAGVGLPENITVKWRRQDGVKYYPTWPELDNTATLDEPDGCYWELIGMLPQKISACVDGVETVYYIGVMPIPDDEDGED